MERLTDEQIEILQVVEAGHNAFVTGQAGSGKSFLVKNIYRSLSGKGKNVVIVCASGIAGTVYADLRTTSKTVHSFYGLKTADLPWNLVIDRAVSDNLLRDRVRAADCIIWDEISMSSRRVCELVNHIHCTLAPECDSRKPFAGKQVIVVGEFLQLRPVPNFFDEGKLAFESNVFKNAFPHRYQLTKILRQNAGEDDFVACLKEVRMGKCSEKCHAFLHSLTRDLAPEIKDQAVHIYFKKIYAQVHNFSRLQQLPGEMIHINSLDEGDVKSIQCPVERVVVLKPNCKVMLLWNKSDLLRNGTAGTYIGKQGDHIIVRFPDVGNVYLKRETWNKRACSGQVIGSRTEFPVQLMYAITCHKSQGLTLPAAVVHCTKEFVPGLIYVALTRVRMSGHLRVLNFKSNQLLAPLPECVSYSLCEGHSELDTEPGFACCRSNILAEEDLIVVDSGYQEPGEQDDSLQPGEVHERIGNVVQAYFERGEPTELVIDLETIYLVLADESNHDIVKVPPPSFSVSKLFEGMKVPDPLDAYAERKNMLLDELVTNSQTELFGRILWSRACKIILEDSLLNLDELQISSTEWSVDSRELYMLITKSSDYKRDLQFFFGIENLSPVQYAICAEMMLNVYQTVVSTIVELVKREDGNEAVAFNVRDMPIEGLAKLRYVGAWTVRKVLNKQLKYVKENLTSTVISTHESVKSRLEMSNLLEEYMIGNIAKLQQETSYPGTLSVTEERQYRSRGLSHIEDVAYEFFVELEVLRVINLNHRKLQQHREGIIQQALGCIREDGNLMKKWEECFPPDILQNKQEMIHTLFDLVINKYIKVGAAQYMRDFRRAHRLKKSAEHRKKVLQRKAILEQRRESVTFQEIMTDMSPGKASTHHRLIAYVKKFGNGAFVKIYTKAQLQKLCQAYGVHYLAKSNKNNLVRGLIPVMNSHDECMPHPYYMSQLRSEVDINDQLHRVVLRVTRQV